MKFLCDNCKAKYQIPDEKVSGRTLRMKCRKCAYNIIIRGPRPDRVASTSTVPPDGPKQASKAKKPRVKTKSVPKRASKPLGAAFRSRVAAPPPPMSAATGDQKVWHCAINDVPIGPIKREELGRKIATKALNGDSLVWREGFDDWRPLKNIPELAQLLTRSRAPRAPTRPARPPARVPPPKAPAPLHSPAASGSQERTAARAGGSNVIPIGGRMGASAAQAFVPAPAPEPPSPEDDFDDEATVLSDNPLQFLAKAAEKPKIPSPRKPGTGPFAKANADAKNADARNADARNAGAWAVPKKTPPVATPPKTEDTAPAKPTAEPSVEPPAPADDGSLDLRFSMPMEAPIEAPIEAPSDPFGLGDVSPSDVGSTPLDEPLSGGFAAPPEEEEDDDEAAVILAGAMPLSRGGGMPIGAWIAIAGAMAFGVALAIVVGTKLMQEPTPVAVVTPPEEPAPVAEPEVEAPVDPPAEVEEATDVADEIEAATAEGETDTPEHERTHEARSDT